MYITFSSILIMSLAWLTISLTQLIIYPEYIALTKGDRIRVKSIRPVSHAILSTFLSFVGLLTHNTNFIYSAFICSFGYFVSDLCIVCMKRDYPFIIHHIISIMGLIIGIIDPLATGTVLFFIFTEISTPFLYRWKICRQLGNTQDEYKYFTDFAYIFCIIRPIGLTCLATYQLIIDPIYYKYNILTYSLFFIAWVLNIGWGIGILNLCKKYTVKID